MPLAINSSILCTEGVRVRVKVKVKVKVRVKVNEMNKSVIQSLNQYRPEVEGEPEPDCKTSIFYRRDRDRENYNSYVRRLPPHAHSTHHTPHQEPRTKNHKGHTKNQEVK